MYAAVKKKLRWVMSCKADGRAKARVVVIGFQDPRLEAGITKADPVVSRRGRQMFLLAAASRGYRVCKGVVNNCLLAGWR